MKVVLLSALLWVLTPYALWAQPTTSDKDDRVSADFKDERININEAGLEELVRLPGVGPTRAEAIIAERVKRRFRRIEDILRVRGIGRKTFRQLRNAIRVR